MRALEKPFRRKNALRNLSGSVCSPKSKAYSFKADQEFNWQLTIQVTMSLNIEQTRLLVSYALEDITENRERLNELDRALGDGDHGTTIARGARAAIEVLRDANLVTINEIFVLAGRAMMKSMGGASGVLFGTFFQGAKACPDSQVFDASTLLSFIKGGLDNLKQKTKAEVGDKTMLDAIVPAVDALAQETEDSKPLQAALKHAAEAAEQGAQSTIGLLPRFGRARTLGDRAASAQDPGATSMSLFLTGLAKHLQEV
jgi:dihydroxyacetone kinase-like protein